MIDYEISSLMSSNPDVDLPNLLDENQHNSLSQLKEELNNLRVVNKKYAK